MTSIGVRISPCGDYVPGYEPRATTTTSNTIPPSYIPQANNQSPIFQTPTCPPTTEPGSPGTPGPGVPGPAAPNTPNAPAPGAPPTSSGGGPAAPGTGGPAGPSAGGPAGPTTGGPAGPTTGGPAGGGGEPASTGGPITGGGSTKYKCVTTTIYCQNDSNIQPPSARRIQAILKNCTICNPVDNFGEPDPTCIYNSQAECIASPCGPNQITESNCLGPITPGGTVTEQSISVGTQTSLGTTTQTSITQTQSSNTSVNAAQQNSLIQQTYTTRTETPISVDSPVYQGFTSSSTASQECPSLYAPYYNFFNTSISQETTLVGNDRYTNIFSNQVAKEVSYFLDRENNTRGWDEKNIANLTTEKIAISLRPTLLQALNNINNIGNTKISSSNFYKAIKSHILRGTLAEFDPDVFIQIAERQAADPLFTYNRTGQSTNSTINLAFAIFESLGINPNYESLGLPQELIDDYKRMRFLPEDLETYVSVLQDDGELYKLYVKNEGLPTLQLGGTSEIPLPFGAGAGYYFSAMFLPGVEYPLMTFNSLSGAYYLSPRDRDNILRILGADPALTLTASSLVNSHEFTATYNPSADLAPVYYKLDLSSVEDIIIPNSVITPVSANYIKITDEEAIQHSRDNGFNVITVNLDYRDPMIQYARDSGIVNYTSNEFNLKSFGRNRTLASDKIILRSIPQAIIISPGNGSYHNPFDGRSIYQDYSNSTVVRTIKIEPGIYLSNLEPQKPNLEKDRLYFDLEANHLGLYEKYLNSDFHGYLYTYDPSGEVYNRAYYRNGEYSNLQPASSLRTNSPEGNLVSLIDNITSALDDFFSTEPTGAELFGFLTWFDVYRRLKANDVGGLMLANSAPILNKLADGMSRGYPIRPVLDEFNAFTTGIPDIEGIIPNDVIIVTLEDRINYYLGNT